MTTIYKMTLQIVSQIFNTCKNRFYESHFIDLEIPKTKIKAAF